MKQPNVPRTANELKKHWLNEALHFHRVNYGREGSDQISWRMVVRSSKVKCGTNACLLEDGHLKKWNL